MFDDAFHLAGGETPDSGMIPQFNQFGFQYAMIIDPPPKLQDRSPAAEVRAVECRQFAYSVGPYREGRLFHKMDGFILLRYEKSMDSASYLFVF